MENVVKLQGYGKRGHFIKNYPEGFVVSFTMENVVKLQGYATNMVNVVISLNMVVGCMLWLI